MLIDPKVKNALTSAKDHLIKQKTYPQIDDLLINLPISYKKEARILIIFSLISRFLEK